MRNPLTRLRARVLALTVGALGVSGTACQDFLDVNTNPNAPQEVSANLYLAPMLHWMVMSPQWDGRFVGRYTQQFTLPGAVLSNWDRMGYDPGSDNGGQQWRDYYWTFGQNLGDMMRKAEAEQRWDLLGVGQVLRAWGWLWLTTTHGELIISEAFRPGQVTFKYDSQEFAYREVFRLLDEAIRNLQRADGAVDQAFMSRGDVIYGGDRQRWLRFAYGLRGMARNHFTNKTSLYRPAEVIADIDRSFTGNADDALIGYPATSNDNTNFLGRTRANFVNFRQTRFVVGLMDGTVTGVVDPRMSRMLVPAPDGVFRGLDINQVGFGGLPTTAQPNNLHGYPGTGGLQLPGRYLFDDRARMPAMTYAQLQFVKAEAAFRAGDRTTALAAYRNGVAAHLDFVNARNLDNNQNATQISAAERNAYLSDTRVVPTDPGRLTLTQIMTQKYIAQWGWGHNELWMDMRRFGYTGLDPATGGQVYPGFAPPTNLFPDNGGQLVWRIRPRFNSEYVWNRAALDAIGGLALDFHTKPLWIFQP